MHLCYEHRSAVLIMKADHPLLRPMISADIGSWVLPVPELLILSSALPFCLSSPQKTFQLDAAAKGLWQICTHELGLNFCTSAHFAKCDPTLFQPDAAAHNVITKAWALDTALHLVPP